MESHLVGMFKCRKCDNFFYTTDDRINHKYKLPLQDKLNEVTGTFSDDEEIYNYLCSVCKGNYDSQGIKFNRLYLFRILLLNFYS